MTVAFKIMNHILKRDKYYYNIYTFVNREPGVSRCSRWASISSTLRQSTIFSSKLHLYSLKDVRNVSSCPTLGPVDFHWAPCFRFMLKTSGHSGVEGYIIKNIKNQINSALQVRRCSFCCSVEVVMKNLMHWTKSDSPLCSQPGNSNTWFDGAHLLPLLRKVFALPDGPETDLLQYLDRSATIPKHSYSVWEAGHANKNLHYFYFWHKTDPFLSFLSGYNVTESVQKVGNIHRMFHEVNMDVTFLCLDVESRLSFKERLFLCGFKQSHGVSEPAALPRHQRQSDREPGECWSHPVNTLAAFHPSLFSSLSPYRRGSGPSCIKSKTRF